MVGEDDVVFGIVVFVFLLLFSLLVVIVGAVVVGVVGASIIVVAQVVGVASAVVVGSVFIIICINQNAVDAINLSFGPLWRCSCTCHCLCLVGHSCCSFLVAACASANCCAVVGFIFGCVHDGIVVICVIGGGVGVVFNISCAIFAVYVS